MEKGIENLEFEDRFSNQFAFSCGGTGWTVRDQYQEGACDKEILYDNTTGTVTNLVVQYYSKDSNKNRPSGRLLRREELAAISLKAQYYYNGLPYQDPKFYNNDFTIRIPPGFSVRIGIDLLRLFGEKISDWDDGNWNEIFTQIDGLWDFHIGVKAKDFNS